MEKQAMKNIEKVVLFLGIVAGLIALFNSDTNVFAEEGTLYEFEEEQVFTESDKNYEYNVIAGRDYEITVSFTGSSATKTKMSFKYNKVTQDQVIPNVGTAASTNDRSGILEEFVVEGTVETRAFTVAMVEDKLILNVSGTGKLISINIKLLEERKAGEKITVYTIGDSLVQTYTEKFKPQTGWGQVLNEYFTESVQFQNYAIGGRSTGNFIRQGRLNNILTKICPGDYVFIQFGHNDASSNNEDRYVSVEDYKINLTQQYIKAVKQRGAIPVIVTLVNRNDYNSATGEFNVSFANYVAAAREVAKTTDTFMIDMNKITVEAFSNINKTLGIGTTDTLIFLHAAAGVYSGEYIAGVEDNTHLNDYGARYVASLMAGEISNMSMEGLSSEYKPKASLDKLCEAPIDLLQVNTTGVGNRMQWSIVDGAAYYKIYVADAKEGQTTSDFKMAGYSIINDFTYKNASTVKEYAYKVVAVNDAGEGKESEILYYDLGKEKTTKKRTDMSSFVVVQEEQNSILHYVIGGVAALIAIAAGIIIFINIKRKKNIN